MSEDDKIRDWFNSKGNIYIYFVKNYTNTNNSIFNLSHIYIHTSKIYLHPLALRFTLSYFNMQVTFLFLVEI